MTWYCQIRAKGLPLTGPILTEKVFAGMLHLDDFKAIQGWIVNFKKGITCVSKLWGRSRIGFR